MRGDAGHPVRLRFAKRGRIRWIGHRDVARAFERALRIERLPVALTEGFSPHPKVAFGLALSVGAESDAEYLDVMLSAPVDHAVLPGRLSIALPEGIDVTGAAALEPRAPSLQEAVTAVEWRATVVSGQTGDVVGARALAGLLERVAELRALPTTRRRKGREVVEDVRPAIRHLECDDDVVVLEVATHPRSPKPEEVLAAIGAAASLPGGLTATHVLRTRQWIERDGARHEPLDADARPLVPEVRAS